MPVREVVLDRDIRSPFEFSDALLSRYHLRRAASVAALMLLDIAAILLAAVAGPPFWHLLGAHIYRISPLGITATALVMIVVFAVQRLYGLRRYRHRVSRIVGSWFLVWLITAMLAVLSGNVISGWSLVALWFTAAIVDIVLRRAYDLAVAAAIGQDLDTVRVLFIGSEEACHSLGAAMIAADPGLSYRAVGRIGGAEAGRLSTLFQELWPSEVVIADLGDVGDNLMGIIEACRSRHCALKVAADEQLSAALKMPAPAVLAAALPVPAPASSSALIAPSASIADSSASIADSCATGDDLADSAVCYLPGFAQPVFLVKDTHARQMHYLTKRAFDVTVAALLLVLLSPVFLIVAVAIKLDSRGPIHFSAPRVGVGQQVFTCYKFRTMTADAPSRQKELEALNEADGAIFKISDDPRVTGVGPRPAQDLHRRAAAALQRRQGRDEPRRPAAAARSATSSCSRTGTSAATSCCPASPASGRSAAAANTSFDEMIELDFRYIETWSFRRDLAILGRTVSAVFGGKGAY